MDVTKSERLKQEIFSFVVFSRISELQSAVITQTGQEEEFCDVIAVGCARNRQGGLSKYVMERKENIFFKAGKSFVKEPEISKDFK